MRTAEGLLASVARLAHVALRLETGASKESHAALPVAPVGPQLSRRVLDELKLTEAMDHQQTEAALSAPILWSLVSMESVRGEAHAHAPMEAFTT